MTAIQSKNWETAFIDVFETAYVGGTGTREEVGDHLVKAVEEYNKIHGTRLIIRVGTA